MDNVKIISDNGVEINVNGIFCVFNSKYYFIYTMGEIDENEYVKLYVVQVCKEVQNTPSGPIDTGYMLGMNISDTEEWEKVQKFITKIVEDKKNSTQSTEIQYLPINMLVNLKIVSKNKFKLMKHIVEQNFKVSLSTEVVSTIDNDVSFASDIKDVNNIDNAGNAGNSGEVIIDYRSRFFEEQEKNQNLEQQIIILNEKLENIKNIIG